MRVPEYVLAEVQPGLAIQWSGRRAFYELIEELSDTLWWSYVIVSGAYGLSLLFNEQRMLFGLLFLVWPLRHIVMEWLRWKSEVYVVARDDAKGGGRTYKFWGWATRRRIEDPITDKSPTVTVTEPWNYRIWGKLTGEHMQKVSIFGDNQKAYIDGRRIGPGFARAIQLVRGAQPTNRVQEMPGRIPMLREINMLASGGILDKKKAASYVEQIIHSEIWGE